MTLFWLIFTVKEILSINFLWVIAVFILFLKLILCGSNHSVLQAAKPSPVHAGYYLFLDKEVCNNKILTCF